MLFAKVFPSLVISKALALLFAVPLPTENKVWFLVHRQELIEQTIETFKRFNINMNNILVGMVQTMANHLDDYEKPTLIIFDEAHHSTANTWLKIINKYSDVAVVGLTATPCRLNGDNLGTIYDKMCVGIESSELCARIRYYVA